MRNIIAARHAEVEDDARATLFAPDWVMTQHDLDWLKLVDHLDAHCWCLHRAPHEYHRAPAGWLAAEAELFARADRLGVATPVLALIHDLKSGEW